MNRLELLMKHYDNMQNFDMSQAGVDRLALISKISWRYKKGFGLRGDLYGLTANEVALLSVLHWYPEINTAHLLRRELGITKGMISRYVDNLLKRGLLVSETDSKDKRIIRLTLSELAVDICKNVTHVGLEFVGNVFSGIEPEEAVILIKALNKVYSNLGELSET